MTLLAVFGSRSETLDFLNLLRRGGVNASALSTPREAGIGCGISVRFEEGSLGRVRCFLAKKSYSSFAGLMKKSFSGYRYI